MTEPTLWERRRWQLEADLEGARVRRMAALEDALGLVLSMDGEVLTAEEAAVLLAAQATVTALRRTW